MFDIGFSELLVIGIVALLVIGPERLPKVARTAGHLFGRFQRYASSIKADISREMELDELRKAGENFKESVEEAARGVESGVQEAEYSIRDEVVSPAEEAAWNLENVEPSSPPAGQDAARPEQAADETRDEKTAAPESKA